MSRASWLVAVTQTTLGFLPEELGEEICVPEQK